jgi:hypothetical protein
MARRRGPRKVGGMNDIRLLDGQVLVVGAGPTGLVLAAELLARGINVRIIDQGDGVALQSRAIGIHARTLEVLDTMGQAERFVERGQVVRHLTFYSEGRRLVSLEFGRCGSRFGFLLARGSASCSTFRRTRPSGCSAPGSPSWAGWWRTESSSSA